MFIVAQIFMTLNVLFFISCFFAKNKTLLFLLQTISSIFFTLQYLCLSAWAGFFSALAELIRITLFFFYQKYHVKQRYQVITVIAAFVASTILTIVTWAAWYSILPLLGLTGVYLTYYSKKLSIVKTGLIITVTCASIYLIILGSYYSAVLEIINLVIGLVGLIKDIVLETQTKKQLKQT